MTEDANDVQRPKRPAAALTDATPYEVRQYAHALERYLLRTVDDGRYASSGFVYYEFVFGFRHTMPF